MSNAIVSTLIISAIAAGLAMLLVIAERFISNYGSCEIDINDGEKKFSVQGGNSLLSELVKENVFIPSACGGRGTCGYCKVKILQGGGNVLPTERPFLSEEEIANNIRLSCQVKVREDIKIFVPRELLAVKEYRAVCSDIRELTNDIRQFRFELKNDETIDYIPGQYVQLFTPKYPGNNEEVYRAYSISSDPANKRMIELIIRLVPNGICTTYCFEHLKVGDEVKFNGPYGDFTMSPTQAPMIFVAGGSGMAPIKCILHHMRNTGSQRKAFFFFGAKSFADQFFESEMREFERTLSDFTYIPVVGQDESGQWQGEKGLVTEAIARKFDNYPEAEGYLCGSPGMIQTSVKTLTEIGVDEEKIYFDSFA